ncbi:HAMP domain-containing sensor histidine kinase [Carboxylicivirga sp. M1479]|uniref:sensor histidine kinase n=1 Tax=Carboxylicivirga sp. M1479 TaxID=2594476 RepID=UPI001177FE9E|nr:HAMP domain-containing sensor histidine kinase [Carboxylicivirga sp. M1479]TRX72234.1 HAMP domain-containing histidine kinase [Carboxylicivirga sp. M1479]
MKLLTKTGLNFISASIFFFFIGSLGGYYFIRYAVNKMFNNELLEAQQQVEQHNNTLLTYADVSIDTLALSLNTEQYSFTDTVMHNGDGNFEFYRKLSLLKPINEAQAVNYTVIRSTAPSDLMVMKFTLMLTVFPIIFFLILYLVNRASTKYSLTVFYDTINKLRVFDVNKENRLDLMTSDIDEFEQLNEVFSAMDKKIKEDYERLKEYTENTSHELQTPLAIINTKLDELIQADNLREEQIQSIAGLIETTNRLSKTNQALIFLAKLDNRVFANAQSVSFNDVVQTELENLEPLISEAKLKVEMTSTDRLLANMNPSLAHTLMQNLLKNAIRHNIPDGYIRISIKQQQLEITNSGQVVSYEPEQMFGRFKKNSQHPQSLGIGLSIVKRICDISDIVINYDQKDKEHIFKLDFSK